MGYRPTHARIGGCTFHERLFPLYAANPGLGKPELGILYVHFALGNLFALYVLVKSKISLVAIGCPLYAAFLRHGSGLRPRWRPRRGLLHHHPDLQAQQLNYINPEAYLADVLGGVADHPARQVIYCWPGTGGLASRRTELADV